MNSWDAVPSYSFKPLHRVVRSLQTSVKSAVRIDRSGMLGVQFMLPELKGKFAYVDFVVSRTVCMISSIVY